MEKENEIEKIRKLLLSEEIVGEIVKKILCEDESTSNSYLLNILVQDDDVKLTLHGRGSSDGGMNKGFQIDINMINIYDYLGDYGDVDFDDEDSILDFKEWVINSDELKRDIIRKIEDQFYFLKESE